MHLRFVAVDLCIAIVVGDWLGQAKRLI